MKNPNINYQTFKIGDFCGKLGYDPAEHIRRDLHFLSRAYGFSEDEKSRIERMLVLLNHIDYAHKKYNGAEQMKYDKGYWVSCAVYKMLSQRKIMAAEAIYLLETRAKIKPYTAKATVELWFRYPLKHLA